MSPLNTLTLLWTFLISLTPLESKATLLATLLSALIIILVAAYYSLYLYYNRPVSKPSSPNIRDTSISIPFLLEDTSQSSNALALSPSSAVAVTELCEDLLSCPICFQTINYAFVAACGHSFCYMCIATHLHDNNNNNCPSCGHYLSTKDVFPNILLSKLLRKISAYQIAKTTAPVEHPHAAQQQHCEVSLKEIGGQLPVLVYEKEKADEEAGTNTQILLNFLHSIRKKKHEELNEIQTVLEYIREDINAIGGHRMKLIRARERCSEKTRMLVDSTATKSWPSLTEKHSSGVLSGAASGQCQICSDDLHDKKSDVKGQLSSQGWQRKNSHVTHSGLLAARKRQVHSQFKDLQECYLQNRQQWTRQSQKGEEWDTNAIKREGCCTGLEEFQSILAAAAQYSGLRVIAEVQHGDLSHSSNIVSSIEFDRDDEYFATASLSRCIKVFEFSSVVNEPTEVHCPVVEMPTHSKPSCLTWNKYTKSQIASCGYDGIVTVWDVPTGECVMEYEEHEKRAWSVDFSHTEPSMLISGGDDCKVKVWCTKQEASVINIDMKANVCSVKYNPTASIYVAVGSSDHYINYYDLRNVNQPLHVFGGNRKSVSYVKFLSSNELASASTDSKLRLWDVKENLPLRTFKGHVNDKNFVGLTANSQYIACGSETNEVFVYHKAITKPVACHKFGSSDLDDANYDDARSYFVTAVCWKSESPILLAGNSQGKIEVLALTA